MERGRVVPELPEVETVRRGLAPAMEGRVVEQVHLARPDLRFPFPQGFAQRLAGRRVERLGRRAKYLIGTLDDGNALIMHLGMSGAFRVDRVDRDPVGWELSGDQRSFQHQPLEQFSSGGGGSDPTSAGLMEVALAAAGVAGVAGEPLGVYARARGKLSAHDHVRFVLGPYEVVYNDPRRFGFMTLAEADRLDEHPYFAHLGMEPVGGELSAERLAAVLAGKGTTLKAALLDQRVIAGLGNIYVCEALWRARLSPRRLAGTVVRRDGSPGERLARLCGAILAVIEEAIHAGGSSLRDYVAADGALGRFQHGFAVYGRSGEPCARRACAGVVARIVQSGRSTWYCPACQR